MKSSTKYAKHFYLVWRELYIVLERGWNLENDWSHSSDFLVGWFAFQLLSLQAPSSPLLVQHLGLHKIQARMVPVEDTLTLKLDLVFVTRYSKYWVLSNDVPDSWNLFYIILLGLSYWVGLGSWVTFRNVLSNSWLLISLMNST